MNQYCLVSKGQSVIWNRDNIPLFRLSNSYILESISGISNTRYYVINNEKSVSSFSSSQFFEYFLNIAEYRELRLKMILYVK